MQPPQARPAQTPARSGRTARAYWKSLAFLFVCAGCPSFNINDGSAVYPDPACPESQFNAGATAKLMRVAEASLVIAVTGWVW